MIDSYGAAINWLGHHLLDCPIKKLIGIDCPGCGMQRSILALLRFDFAGSWHAYPPGIFICATIVFLLFHLFFRFRQGAFILKLLYIVSTIAIIANYTHKIITHQLY